MDELSRTSLGFLKDLVVMSHLSIIAGSVAMDTLQHEPRPEGEANSTENTDQSRKITEGLCGGGKVRTASNLRAVDSACF